MIADNPEWQWANNDVLLLPLRTARNDLEAFKSKNAFWENWKVAGCPRSQNPLALQKSPL